MARKARAISRAFFQRHTLEVAKDLLGKVLVITRGRHRVRVRIVEVEAYRGTGRDPASHSARGLTPRNAPMFEAGGISYVYFIYGMYVMFNIVTEPKGRPGAVLIRGVELLEAHSTKKHQPKGALWTNGPGKLTQVLGITMKDNAISLQGPRFKIERLDLKHEQSKIKCSPRVGIREGRHLYWRFFIHGCASVSRVRENQWARPI